MEYLCNICPRNCNVDRSKVLGFCKANDKIKVAKVMLHYFEEPPISGEISKEKKQNGSGAIFFSNCNLKCVFCQNSEISANGLGKEISVSTLANIFKQLEDAGANNINLVSPTHYTLQILEALKLYKPKIPVVWNTSGYEKPETIRLLKGFVDIFLTDFKYFDSNLSKKVALAENYPEMCKLATLEMRKIQPEDIFENGLMKRGVIVRHLVLPGQTADSKNIIHWIFDNLGNKTYLSLMSQYTPMAGALKIKELNRTITPLEYKVLIKELEKLGFENVFLQDFSSASSVYTPDFAKNDGVFKF